MFVEIFFCVLLVFVALYFNEEVKNAKERNEILKIDKAFKELNLNRLKERQKYVNVILDFEKEENK